MKSMNPFDYVNAINSGKNIVRDSNEPEAMEKGYNRFIVNRSFSYHRDTLFQANEINRYPDVDNLLAFEFLLNSIRPKKRFSKWSKKMQNADIDIIKEYYGYNDRRALEALSVLTKEQLKIIKRKLEKGGSG